ncbi:MAG: hypothetical protein JXM68_07790, partial [Sedimentisphaerales bacterium]|nr:hypothetical protein [Sedimentisphaerales bacterium]
NYPNFFYRLSDIKQTGFQVPMPIVGGKIFISIGEPLYMTHSLDDLGRVGYAGPSVENPADPNFNTEHDAVEFTVDQYGFFVNITQVDHFSIPISFDTYSVSMAKQSAGFTEDRATIYSAYRNAAMPQAFKDLIYTYGGKDIRVVCPSKSATFKAANPTYYDSYVTEVWDYYKTHTCTFTTDVGTFNGTVGYNDVFSFMRTKDGVTDGPWIINGKPNAEEIFEGSGKLCTGSEHDLNVQKFFVAALTRHVAGDTSTWANDAAYYQAGPANFYSKFWHDHGLNGRAYGFAYDDVYDKSSSIVEGNARAMVVKINH